MVVGKVLLLEMMMASHVSTHDDLLGACTVRCIYQIVRL